MMIETKFKKTDIGEIPEDWDIKALGDIGEPKMCKRIMKSQTKEFGDIPFYKIGTFGNIPNAFISKELFEDYKNKFSFPRKGEILISAAGTIGRAIIYNGEDSYYQDSNIVWIDNNESFVLNSFLFNIYKIVEWDTNTGTISRLYNDNLKRTLIQFPPIAEQQRIATVLSDIDALLSILSKKIEKKKLIKQGVMQRLLTGKKRLAGFTRPWVKKNITEICTIKARIGWQGLKTDEYLDYGNFVLITGTDFENGGINWSNCSFVSKERFEQDENIKIKQGDVLITKDGSIGKVAYLDFIPMEGTLNSGVFVVRPKDISNLNNNYLALFFKSKFFEDFIAQLKAGSTIAHLYQKDFIRLQLNYPKDLSEQAAIVTIFSDMDREIEALEAKRVKYEQVKQGMMQQLLTGKIRLID
ncbi:restriction endonuclease subunit S [Bacteroides ovatus]|uniref:restriction endonuclease subunit S n=1 Tax=Bacteroides ovatus TaxID=28116 RepID=UPI002165F715|nr:restriction endonuclease subunit S [Bacteroides ovatus]MCS3238064.1 restriction endonuclease subunit S [Bacteroides ovatus]